MTERKRFPRRAKTPTIFQLEAVECGSTSLAIVLAYYKRYVPLEELRIACGVSRNGSNVFNLIKAAKNYGLEAKGYRKKIDTLKQLKPPFVVFWNFCHFLVVEGFGKGKVYLNDPAMGPRTVTDDEFDKSYTGVVVTFSKDSDFRPGGKPLGITNTIRSRLKGSWAAVAFAGLASLGLVFPGIVIPAFSRILVDDYLVEGMKGWLRPLLLGMAVTAFFRIALSWIQEYFLLRFETKLSVSGSAKFLHHILRLPIMFYSQRYGGEISSRVAFNNDVADALANRLASTAIDILMILFFGAIMLSLDMSLSFLAFSSVFFNMLLTTYLNRSMKDGNLRLQQENGKAIGTAMDGLSNIETLKGTGGEHDFFATWSGHHAKVTRANQNLGLRMHSLLVLSSFISGLTEAGVLVFAGYKVMSGALTMGTIVAFQSLMHSFSDPARKLVNLASVIQDLQGKLVRLDDVMTYEQDPLIGNDGSGVPERIEKLNGCVEMRNITFGYSRMEEPLITDFSMKLTPGSRVALVGPSGCGKSTVAKLLSGLYEPWEGEILFDDKNRKEIPRNILTNSLAVVDQDISMFAGNIRENISLWDQTMPEKNIMLAAKDALIHDDIAQRSQGYDAKVSEGGKNFSGGQCQRLEIARALAVNPRIMIMDEATSALDTLTEQKIDRNLRRRGCTCIIIAHRLSTIRDADEIIVLDKGQIVQRGTHSEMIRETNSAYAALVKRH